MWAGSRPSLCYYVGQWGNFFSPAIWHKFCIVFVSCINFSFCKLLFQSVAYYPFCLLLLQFYLNPRAVRTWTFSNEGMLKEKYLISLLK